MRILIRIALALLLLVALGFAALAVLLPRLVQSEALRERLRVAAREATGREVTWEELGAGVLPPRLVVKGARVAGRTEKDAPLLEGADVELRVALLPLLARAVVVDSLVVEGATLRLLRTPRGFELPKPEPAAAGSGGAAQSAPESVAPRGGAAAPGFALAVREVALREARVVIEDRAVTPAVTWDLGDLDAKLHGSALDAPVDIEASGTLASGGRLALRGRGQQAGPFELELDLDALVLDPAAPYLPAGQKLSGRVSGQIGARGQAPDVESVTFDLRLEDAEIAVDEVFASGRMKLRGELAGDLAKPNGSFALDATEATLRYGDAFQKGPGKAATAEGRIVTGPDGSIGLDDTRVRISNVDAKLSVQGGAHARVAVDAAPFELAGWETLLPALAESPPEGRLGFENLVLTGSDVRGRIALEEVRLRRPDGADLRLSGALVGEGALLRGDGLQAFAGTQPIPIDLRVHDPLGARRIELRSRLENADTGVLLGALAGKPNLLRGPLELDADVRAVAGGDAPLLETLSGPVRFAIRPGQIEGVSLLRGVVERLGSAGEAALLIGRLRGGNTLQRFYADEFTLLSATLRLGDGLARTDDLRLVYDNYSVDLRGSVGLTDLALDMTGELSIDEELDAALTGAEASAAAAPATPPAAPADGATAAATGRRRVIPLAHVRGTLTSPRIDLSPQAIAALTARGSLESKKVQKYEKKVDEVLGPGAGQSVREALEGLLGGRGE